MCGNQSPDSALFLTKIRQLASLVNTAMACLESAEKGKK